MKYLLFALLLFPIWVPAQAQNIVPAATIAPYRYCALVVDDSHFSSRNRLTLDYGQTVKGAPAEPEMAEMAKNIDGSTSVIDALNYLSRHGWELLTVTNVPSQTTGTSGQYITSESRYLHRRRATAP
jgi:hypothetical protein